ncbi:MAG: precorrin-2 C(20)-methyltransferase [Desulfobacteraceae bacterium]|nr:precorrin-2 C(20)-methyltransferase [Desulfobacteraceae bacterium]
MLGTLYGIGVGPGDPELLTIKAVKVLRNVAHVFAAASSSNDYSLAQSIVAEHLQAGVPVDQLAFPMTYNPERLESAWQVNCDKIVDILGQGKNVAFLTLGDPLTFSTFIYIMRKIGGKLPEVKIEVVPGITSFQAAAACANLPLAEGEEAITILSAAKGADRLKQTFSSAENIVLMKTYKQFPQILAQIREEGLQNNCCFVSRCGLDGEIVERDFEKLVRMKQPNYLSLMIIKKNGLEKK